jgi:hypothetical protein
MIIKLDDEELDRVISALQVLYDIDAEGERPLEAGLTKALIMKICEQCQHEDRT